MYGFFFFSSRRRHTRYWRDWSSDVCSSDLAAAQRVEQDAPEEPEQHGLQVPKGRDREDDSDEGELRRDVAEGKVGAQHRLQECCGGDDDRGPYDGRLLNHPLRPPFRPSPR